MHDERPSPAHLFAEHYFAFRSARLAIVHAGLGTGDEDQDQLKGEELLAAPWCQSYLIGRYKEVYGVPDLDGASLTKEEQDELVASQAEVKQTLTRLLRNATTLPRDRIRAALALERIRENEKQPAGSGSLDRIKDLLGLR